METTPDPMLGPARSLLKFIIEDFTVDGAHMLAIGHGEPTFFGFGKFRGMPDYNFLEHRNFANHVETVSSEREGYLSFLCLTSYIGALPPAEGRTFRFSELRTPRHRFGWLVNNSTVTALSAKSLKNMIPKENGVKLKSAVPPPLPVQHVNIVDRGIGSYLE